MQEKYFDSDFLFVAQLASKQAKFKVTAQKEEWVQGTVIYRWQ